MANKFNDLQAGMSPEAQELAKEATLILSPQATTQVLKPYFDYVEALEKEVVTLRARVKNAYDERAEFEKWVMRQQWCHQDQLERDGTGEYRHVTAHWRAWMARAVL